MTPTRWLLAAGGVVALVLFWAFWAVGRADKRADVAEGRTQVLDSLRQVAEAKARTDSVALESARTDFVADSSRLALERSQAVRRASQAARVSDTARVALVALLDSLGASHEALDRLDAAHEAQVLALVELVAVADSATVVERSLRLATERALTSERTARNATEAERLALGDQVRALQSARRWDRFKVGGIGGLAVAGIVAWTILR